MTDRTKNPRLRRAALALTALALLVAATAGLGTGSAVAKQDRGGNGPHLRHGGNHIPPFPGSPPSWPGGGNPWPGGGTLPGAGTPVPGQDTSLDPTELQPPVISVLKDSGNLAPGSVFVAPKITTAGTPGQQGPEIVDNEGRPIFFQPIDLPY